MDPYEKAAEEIIEEGIRSGGCVPFIREKPKLALQISVVLRRHFRLQGDSYVPLPDIREEVQSWANRMEARLRKHDERRGRSGWLDRDPREILLHLLRDLGQLAEILNSSSPELKSARERSADVANLACMVFDSFERRNKSAR